MASEDKLQVALKAVLLKFGIDELKEEQITILNCLMERHDCIAVLPTGYGKSLPFQMVIPLRMVLSRSDDLDSMSTYTTINKVEKIIVCCPLISLMKDLVVQLKEIYCAKVAFKESYNAVSAKFKKSEEDSDLATTADAESEEDVRRKRYERVMSSDEEELLPQPTKARILSPAPRQPTPPPLPPSRFNSQALNSVN